MGRTALVLSGGGARGAYEVGLLAGIVDVLGLGADDRPPFSIFAGTSVGAINATWLAAHADRGDMDIAGLVQEWENLRLADHLKIDPLGFLGWPRKLPLLKLLKRTGSADLGPIYGRSLLDPRPFHEIVEDHVPWDRLHRNVDSGRIDSLIVTALHIGSGRTHMFVENAPGREFAPSKDPRRVGVCEPITSDHVLASAALPMLFPARRIGGSYFCDGGIRHNTPLSPAIRSGADQMMVVSLLKEYQQGYRNEASIEAYPNPFFLLGKLLAALLIDPVDYDLHVLERMNQLLGLLDESLDASEKARFDALVEETRGVGYRQIDTLTFRPTDDIGRMAGTFLRERGPESKAHFITEQLLERAAMLRETNEADLVSFLLFDGGFAERLIALGRQDAEDHADRIRAFFAE